MELRVDITDLEVTGLADLDWAGGAEHVRAVAEVVQLAYAGQAVVLQATLANGHPVGMVAVDLRPDPAAGLIWMLAVHERFQSLGVGTALVRAAETRIAAVGRTTARLDVELDNPGARRLYLRLGYTEAGAVLDHWRVPGERTYAAACLRLERSLPEPGSPAR